MRSPKPVRRWPIGWRRLFGLLLALLVGGGLAALHLTDGGTTGVLAEIEGRSLDWRFRLRGPQSPPESVAIVAVDDRTLAALGRFPLPRATLALAVDRLTEAGATTVGLDLLLLEREPPSDGIGLSPGDLALRDALARQGGAVLGMALIFDPRVSLPQEIARQLATTAYRLVERPAEGALLPPGAQSVLLPLDALQRVAALGHVNLILDADGAPRHLHPAVAVGELLLPAFAVQAARRHLGLSPDEIALSLGGSLRLGERELALDRHLAKPLDFFGPRGTIATHSLIDLLEGGVPAEALAGRAVLIGVLALGVGDTFPSPFDQALPGVEVLATGVANLTQDGSLSRPAWLPRWEALAIVAAAVAAWGLASLPNPRLAALAAIATFLVWPIATYLAFLEGGLWVNLTLPCLAFLLSAALGAGSRAAEERRFRREAERQRQNLARYVSPLMVEQQASEEVPSFDQREQAAAILFFDLSGFTRLAETRTPAETASFLKDFHGRLEEIVTRHAGVVEQFLGDGAMVIFGLPQPQADDPVRALACARELVSTLGRWRPEVRPRAGLHYGPVVMARLGGRQQQLAAAGDTVNVASRLESLASAGGWALMVSDALVAAVRAAGRVELLAGLTPEPARTLRGRTGRLALWRAARHSF